MIEQNYYELLEVAADATKEELKRSYYKLAKKYHPDINPKTANLFKEISVAYSVLSDPKQRANYDLLQDLANNIYDEKYNINKEVKKEYDYSSYNQSDCYGNTYSRFDDMLDDLYDLKYERFFGKTYNKLSEKEKEELNKYKKKALNILDEDATQHEINKLTIILMTVVGTEREKFWNDIEKQRIKHKTTINKVKEDIEKYKRKVEKDNWFKTSTYYTTPKKESILKIIKYFTEYRFENAIASIWNRNFIVILFTIIPLILNLLNIKNKYNLSKTKILIAIPALVILGVSKLIFNILYSMYWIFSRILRYFLIPVTLILVSLLHIIYKIIK